MEKDKQVVSKRDDEEAMDFFQKNHGFRPPYDVFCDASYMEFIATTKKNPVVGFREVLKGQVKLVTTRCVRELVGRDEELKDTVHETWCCHVESGLLPCLESVVECQNQRKFVFATADDEISSKMQQRYGVPVILVGKGERFILHRASNMQRDLAHDFLEECKRALEVNKFVIEFYKRHYLIEDSPLKILLDGPFIQHLALNGIPLSNVAQLVGTDLNSLYITSCIYEEMKVAGNSFVNKDMEGALLLATGFVHQSCGHFDAKTGKQCLQSLLVKGKHIGAILNTRRVMFGNVQRMDGVPFILAKEKMLILKPPSETLINSHEDDVSTRVKLLEISAEAQKLLEDPPKKTRQARKKRFAEQESTAEYDDYLAKNRKLDTTKSG